ncbi:hypothetical protein AAFC00_001376 [Neodothiora populina]|uniref:Uncharacterized protein n=1 Tax=Neodothiora populina TaxID=2781224 RepID=A0ABR3PNR7_9PEZI
MPYQNTLPAHSADKTCYFSLPTQNHNNSNETPLFTPSKPADEYSAHHFTPTQASALLERYHDPWTFTMSAPGSMQLPTRSVLSPTTNQSRPRPQLRPLQNMLHVDDCDDDSSSSNDSTSTASMSLPNCAARCSRCQRTLSIDASAGSVSYGLNLYYCARCAGMVGYGR